MELEKGEQMNYTLKNEKIESFNESKSYTFPKYTSQLINWANQNAQGPVLPLWDKCLNFSLNSCLQMLN